MGGTVGVASFGEWEVLSVGRADKVLSARAIRVTYGALTVFSGPATGPFFNWESFAGGGIASFPIL